MRKLSGLLLVAFWMVPLYAAPRYSAYDVALHLQQCTKRPVFFTLPIAGDLSSDSLPPCDQTPLTAWLAGRKLTMIWQDSLLLIDRPGFHSPNDPGYWTKLALKAQVRKPAQLVGNEDDSPDQYKYIPLRRALTDAELREAGNWIFQETPMPPVFYPERCPSCGDAPQTATIRVDVVLEGVRLSEKDPEAVVGWIGTPDANRLIVGKFVSGKFQLEWLSPLLQPFQLMLSFRDVDADGVAEIWSESTWFAGSEGAEALSIFDVSGRELTRGAGDCGVAVGASGPKNLTILPATCPITGYPNIEHDVEDDGTVALIAHWDVPGEGRPNQEFKLVDGKYVLERAKAAKPRHR